MQTALVGLVAGVILGLAARLARFCTLGALEDMFYGGSDVRLRMWGVAMGTAMIGAFALIQAGLLDPMTTLYLGQTWHPVGTILGGLSFGYGMALAGNCGYGALARLGGGDLRSLVIVLVMGITGYATLSGPLASLRVAIFPNDLALAPQGVAHALAAATGMPAPVTGGVLGAVIVLASAWPKRMRQAPQTLFWSGAAGAAIVLSWAGNAWVTHDSFGATPVVAPTFVSPVGEAILWTMTASGQPMGYAVGLVPGVALGALLGSRRKGQFRWEVCDDARELGRLIAGATLMGFGGVLAVGCSIGQGLSAMSLLAFSAPVALAAIAVGALLGLRHLIAGHGV